MKFSELLQSFEISGKLVVLINNIYSRMIQQLRFSLGKLNGVTTSDINRLFAVTGLTPQDFSEVLSEYPKNVFVMQQPIYSLLALIVLKSYAEGNQRLALDTNTLLGLTILGRRRYKYISFVDQNIFDKTINSITKKTYIGMHGALWMLNRVTKSVHDKYIKQMLDNVDDMYPRYRYIIDMYNRFNQIMKTIARRYYYNIAHRDEVPRDVQVKNRANEVLEFVLKNPIPPQVLNYVSEVSGSQKVNELYHMLQMYYSIQSQFFVIFTLIVDRMMAFLDAWHSQNPGVPLNVNDPNFVPSFINKLKRSTIILRSVSSEIFSQYGFDRFLVLYFAFVVVLYVDSKNHPAHYAGGGKTEEDTPNLDSNLPEDNDDVGYYEETMSMYLDGIIEDPDFFAGDFGI